MPTLVLTPDQQGAINAFCTFLADPIETVFVLKGYSGTGKTTLVHTLMDRLPDLMKTIRLINPNTKEYAIELTATTNKAAEAFAGLVHYPVSTIHSFLGLRVETNHETGQTHLIPRSNALIEGRLIFIDEASYIDKQLLTLIFKLTRNCKIVFMGDPAQLTPVKSSETPVFNASFTGAELTEVVRQAKGNPIIELSTLFRHTVNTGKFFSFTPDGHHIQHLPRSDFDQAIIDEFTRPNWRYRDSKILAWTNKCVIDYNHAVRDLVKGNPDFQVGDYAVCNKYVGANQVVIRTDQLVQITGISEPMQLYSVVGHYYTIDNKTNFFGPKSLEEKKALIKRARAMQEYNLLKEIETRWIDLRAAYACTINKAQGSTFDKVFIDLDDVRRCNSGDQIARMLYVAVSRARTQVILTGDIA